MGILQPMVVSAQEAEDIAKHTVELSLESGGSGKVCDLNLLYSHGWFSVDSMTYNNDLSTISAALAGGAYGETKASDRGALM